MNRSSALSPPGAVERPAPPSGYSTKDVAALLGLSAGQVRSYVRSGFLAPQQGPRGEYYFSFQDLVLLRTAKGLLAARVPRRRVRLALQNLREQLPDDRPLTGVRISAQGHHVVVRDGRTVWNPESGQAVFDFELSELAREASTLPLRTPETKPDDPEGAEDWYERGSELEEVEPEEAMAAYRQALEIDPGLVDAHVNLGRAPNRLAPPVASDSIGSLRQDAEVVRARGRLEAMNQRHRHVSSPAASWRCPRSRRADRRSRAS